VDAHCILVHAVPDVWAPGGMAPLVNGPDVLDRVTADLRQSLAQQFGAEVSDAASWELVVRSGRPGVVLDQVAREYKAGLIVVGGRHHGALARGFGGSTAHYLVRTCRAPVLVVGADGDLPRQILVATELSFAASPVLSTAWRYADLLTAQLRVVHVIEPARFPTVVPLSLDTREFEVWSRREFQRLVELELPRVPSAERIVRRGQADEEIAEEAVSWRADLVVIGSHGRGWVDRALIGSTTERLLNRLPASLLVVPIKGPAAKTRGQSRRRSDQREAVTL
jgi:nucleotide-binding universal stress UspA family protein